MKTCAMVAVLLLTFELLVADLPGLSPGQDLYWMELVVGLLPAPGL